ncbi:cation transport protein-domain-containing protein [Leptodontidium sp. 2 PMI_412]|nr:cation transport protein-domain-containing protein [Leptodontidium sp. 2 PMI_412]
MTPSPFHPARLLRSLAKFKSNERLRHIARYLPPLNFITIHYAYFISTCLVTSLLFWGASRPEGRISYADSLFLVVSAMTEAGLNTVNLSEMTTFQQVLLFLLIIIGSSIFVSVGTVWTRKRVFEKRFKGVVKGIREGRGMRRRMRSRSRSFGAGKGRTNGSGGLLGGNGGGSVGREVSVGERLEEQRKEREGGDERVFESRHSGPKDPTHLTFSTPHPSRGPDSDSLAVGVDRKVVNSEPGSGTGEGIRAGDGVGGGKENEKGDDGPTADVELQSLETVRSRTRTGTGTRSRSRGTGTGRGDPDRISIMRYPSFSHRDQDPSAPPTTATPPPRRLLNFVGVGAHPHPLSSASGTASASAYSHPQPASGTLLHRLEKKAGDFGRGVERDLGLGNERGPELDQAMYPHYLTRRTTGRNAQFFGLTREEREHLGGVEYRAITLLGWIVPLYFVLWQVLGCIGLGAYMQMNKEEVIRANGINPWWLGVFNGVSAFNNSGMSLLDANLIPFQTSIYTLVTMGVMILAGNTAYPLILRLILWLMLKTLTLLYPDPVTHSVHKATLRFILTYPRRVYTNLFPATPTLWLLFMVITLNGVDWIAFELLNIGNAAVEVIPARFRVLDGLFQALAVRSGGFYIIGISDLRIGLQVLYVIMMYISVYPVVITMRHSNVYEERSLGIYAEDESDDTDEESRIGDDHDDDNETGQPKSQGVMGTLLHTLSALPHPFTFPTAKTTTPQQTRSQFIRQQIRGQLAHDIWLLVLAILVITCIEVSSFENDPVTFSVFNIIFEVVSGYGCVGISTGMKGEAYSFSGGWRTASKVVLCGVMLRGRHRGLPVALDRAVRLPGWEEGGVVRERGMGMLRFRSQEE